MADMRIAVLSDIHGNLPALLSVARKIRDLSPDAVYVVGDMVNGCPWSAEVLDCIASSGWEMLMGNHDDAVLQLGAGRMEPRYARRDQYGALWWTREHLSPAHVTLLESLPREIRVSPGGAEPLRLVHGVPGNFLFGFFPHEAEGWYRQHLNDVSEPVVVGGHTHDPMIRKVKHWLVVNAGSVGAPYDGDRRASFALLEAGRHGWTAEIQRVADELAVVDRGFTDSSLLVEGGVMALLFRRSVLSGQPWVADFVWWMQHQTGGALGDMQAALSSYDRQHGPGRWAFPHARNGHAHRADVS